MVTWSDLHLAQVAMTHDVCRSLHRVRVDDQLRRYVRLQIQTLRRLRAILDPERRIRWVPLLPEHWLGQRRLSAVLRR
jgi:hypothetical protein